MIDTACLLYKKKRLVQKARPAAGAAPIPACLSALRPAPARALRSRSCAPVAGVRADARPAAGRRFQVALSELVVSALTRPPPRSPRPSALAAARSWASGGPLAVYGSRARVSHRSLQASLARRFHQRGGGGCGGGARPGVGIAGGRDRSQHGGVSLGRVFNTLSTSAGASACSGPQHWLA